MVKIWGMTTIFPSETTLPPSVVGSFFFNEFGYPVVVSCRGQIILAILHSQYLRIKNRCYFVFKSLRLVESEISSPNLRTKKLK